MHKRLIDLALLAAIGWATWAALPARAADEYGVDPMHSSVSFRIAHMNVGSVHGRFDKVSGKFVLDDADPSKSSFTFTLQTDSVDTNQPARDGHLRGGEFFDAKQFPTITFQ